MPATLTILLRNIVGSAAELMWNANCGFLPVVAASGKVVGSITDRDICIALGARNRLPGDVIVGEVMSGKLFACSPADDIQSALQIMKHASVRRVAVIVPEGALVGVISMDDILSRTALARFGKKSEVIPNVVAQ